MTAAPLQESAILLVDDEPKNIQLLGNLLQEQGYAVEFATSGAEALQWVQTRAFDLILLDVMMPGMDGYEVCKRLKQMSQTRDIPVIFLTAKTETDSVVQGFKLGAVDYVTKPFHKEELLARITTHLALLDQQRLLDKYATLLEEKNLELSRKNAQLEELNASKDKFFSIIAHDLKNPMSSFLAFANLLENIEQSNLQEVPTLAHQFRTSAENLFALLENLLTWSRLQRGMLDRFPQSAPFDLLLTRSISPLEPTLEQKQITLTHAVPTGLSVYTDINMLVTVLRNLIANAIKFTPAGGRIEVQAEPAGDMLRIAVADTGIGIPADKLDELFRIEAKMQRAGTAGEKGTGLGLILCKEFIEKNGGAIWVESQVGQGSTFFFTAPQHAPDEG